MHCNNILQTNFFCSADSRAIIDRMTTDIRRLPADGSLIKCHRPTVWRLSADWRPMIGRPSTIIMMKISSNSRLTVDVHQATWLPDASPMTKPMKIGGSVNDTFYFGASKKSRRPTIISAKSLLMSADNRTTYPKLPNFCSLTVGRLSVLVMWL